MLYEDMDLENPSPLVLRFNPKLVMDEIADFAVVIMQAYDRYAELRGAEDEAKENVRVVDATIGDRMREEAATHGLKLTEARIEMDILIDNDHIDAVNKLLEARLATAKYNAFLEGLNAKKSMMDLFGELVRKGFPMPGLMSDDGDRREASWKEAEQELQKD